MSNKGNFAQALRELTGFDAKDEDLMDSDFPEASEVFTEMPEAISAQYTSSFSVPDFSSAIEGQTSITANMKVIGDIKSEDNLNIKGQVFGNITTSESILTSNLIVGTVEGDISAKGNVIITGIVKGNIKKVALSSQARVKGNIKTASFGVEFGAKLNGNFQMV